MSAHTERGIVTKYVCCPRRTRDRLRSKIARREAVVVESQADRQVAGKLLMGKTGRGEYRGRPRTRRGTWTQPYRSEAEKGCRLFSFGPALTMSHLPYRQPVRISDTRLSILRLRPCNWRVYVYIYIYMYTRIRFTNISAASVRDEVPVSARDTSLSQPRLFFALALRRWAVMIFFVTENRASREEKRRGRGGDLIIYVIILLLNYFLIN